MVVATPPKARHVLRAEQEVFAARANRITIRHPLGRVVCVIEIVSPGNKASRAALRAFVEKTVAFLRQGVHLLVIDLFPPSARDPHGMAKAIWDEIEEQTYELPADKRLTLAALSPVYRRRPISRKSRSATFCRTCRRTWTQTAGCRGRWKRPIRRLGPAVPKTCEPRSSGASLCPMNRRSKCAVWQ